MNRKRLIAAVVSVVAVAALSGGIWATQHHDSSKQTNKQTSAATQTAQKPTTDISYKGVEGKTALELLRQHAKVTTKDTSYGPYVESINGVAASGGKYWMFYVNGQQANVGAGAYTTKTGDTIQWKLQ